MKILKFREKKSIFFEISKFSFVGLGVLWVPQALFLKIFGKFEKFRILFICLVFSYDETSLRYLDLNFSKNVPKRGGGHAKYVTFLGTYFFVPMMCTQAAPSSWKIRNFSENSPNFKRWLCLWGAHTGHAPNMKRSSKHELKTYFSPMVQFLMVTEMQIGLEHWIWGKMGIFENFVCKKVHLFSPSTLY